jgi:cell division protein FtsQ
MLHREGIYPEGKPISEVDLDSIESVVKNSEYIEEAQCVMMRNGDVYIYAKQLIPVLRVFSRGESYYVNKDGKKMKAASDIHTDLPVVIGNFSMASDALIVLPISKYVQRDATWNGIVTMYSVKDKNNIVIIPSIYGHVVNFGDSSNVENKFAKLRQFYREVMPVKGWNTYDTITLKWNHQIVANRRSKRIKPILVTDSVIDEEAPSIESISFERGN